MKKIISIFTTALLAVSINAATLTQLAESLPEKPGVSERSELIKANLSTVKAAFDALKSAEDLKALSAKEKSLLTRYAAEYVKGMSDEQAAIVAALNTLVFANNSTPAQRAAFFGDPEISAKAKTEVYLYIEDLSAIGSIDPANVDASLAARYMRLVGTWAKSQTREAQMAKYRAIVNAWSASVYGGFYTDAEKKANNLATQAAQDKIIEGL